MGFIFAFYAILFGLKDKRVIKGLVIFILTSLAYAFFRLSLLKSAYVVPLSFLRDEGLYVRVLSFIKSFLYLIGKVLIPINIPFERHFVVRDAFNLYLVVFGIMIAILYHFRKEKVYLFFTLSCLISLIPVSNIILPISASLRAHFIYFSSFMIIAVVLMFIAAIKQRIKNKLVRNLFYLFSIFYISFLLYQRSIHINLWRDKKVFYLKQIELEPNSFLALNNLGREYFKDGDYENAFKYFYLSALRSPKQSYTVAWNNLGVIYQRRNEIEMAIECYKKSIETGDYYLAYRNLIELYLALGRKKELLELLNKALIQYPSDEYFIHLRSYISS